MRNKARGGISKVDLLRRKNADVELALQSAVRILVAIVKKQGNVLTLTPDELKDAAHWSLHRETLKDETLKFTVEPPALSPSEISQLMLGQAVQHTDAVEESSPTEPTEPEPE